MQQFPRDEFPHVQMPFMGARGPFCSVKYWGGGGGRKKKRRNGAHAQHAHRNNFALGFTFSWSQTISKPCRSGQNKVATRSRRSPRAVAQQGGVTLGLLAGMPQAPRCCGTAWLSPSPWPGAGSPLVSSRHSRGSGMGHSAPLPREVRAQERFIMFSHMPRPCWLGKAGQKQPSLRGGRRWGSATYQRSGLKPFRGCLVWICALLPTELFPPPKVLYRVVLCSPKASLFWIHLPRYRPDSIL